jgi:hypothetical protein
MRILLWNIQSFTLDRIDDKSGNNFAERAASSEKSLANSLYITNTIEEADPDIFVVLEARTGRGPVAQLATGNGPAGLIHLLSDIREWTLKDWFLVPPLRVNPPKPLTATHTETVGVFWRNDRLAFTGPYVWPGGGANASGPPIAPGGAAGATYPQPWDRVVPDGTTAAAWCRYYNEMGAEVLFNDDTHRRPYWTAFQERAGAGRTVNLYSVHFKPGVDARTAAARFSRLPPPPGAGQFDVVAGDYNINLAAPTLVQWAALELYGWDNFVRVSPPGNAPTLIAANGGALPGAYLRNFCLDFGFVRYGAGTQPAVGNGPVAGVIDRVAGTAAVAPLPAFTKDMAQTLASMAGIENLVEQARMFRTRWNYGHISPPAPGTSDHLPILLQV